MFFFYVIFPTARDDLRKQDIELHQLTTWWDVLAVVKKDRYLQAAQVAEVEKFLHEPAKWSAAHGGVAAFPSS